MATEPEPEAPPPDAMSWERRASQPPRLNDQTAELPFWLRPFAKPEVERRAASQPMSVVVTQVCMPYVLAVVITVNALLGVPLRHMLFTVPATAFIGFVMLLLAGGTAELIGRATGYRPARASWTTSAERSAEALAKAIERAATAHGFVTVWSKDHTFVATRNVKRTSMLVNRPNEHMPLRLSLLAPKPSSPIRTLQVGIHALCLRDTGEAELVAAVAREIVRDAAKHEPWVAGASS